MDPNACLERILQAARDNEREELDFACEDLWNWLNQGGFPPEKRDMGQTLQAVHDPGWLPKWRMVPCKMIRSWRFTLQVTDPNDHEATGGWELVRWHPRLLAGSVTLWD